MDQSQAVSSEEDLARILASFNRTELYQLCRSAGLSVHPGWRAEHFLAVIVQGAEYAPTEHPVDSLRDGLISFINEYWRTLQAQLKCPAKNLKNPDPDKVDLKPCYKCIDMQVVACVARQSPVNQQRLLQLRIGP